jgi:hypothetical protein
MKYISMDIKTCSSKRVFEPEMATLRRSMRAVLLRRVRKGGDEFSITVEGNIQIFTSFTKTQASSR